VHTVSAAYVTGSVFVLAISAYYLLRQRNVEFAKRSMVVAAAFGLASAFSVVVLGDESGYIANLNQHMKIAAIEGMWQTEPAPASFNLIGMPDQQAHETRYTIKVPYLLGLIATRSLTDPLPGIDELVLEGKTRIEKGISAYKALQQLKRDPANLAAQTELTQNANNLGYALLLKRFNPTVINATPDQINKAAWSLVPEDVATLFWSFRIMVGCGMFFIALFLVAFILSAREKFQYRWFLRIALFSLPLPWLASEVGWYVAEHGRQPWVIEGVLPTSLGTSSLSMGDLWLSLTGFIIFYTLLAVVEVYLMVKYIRLGPDGMQHYENNAKKSITTVPLAD
jgi:cytochrome d ubiquinol oxidase subunit I